MQDDDLFEQCDALGIMVLPGLCCCDAWQSWDVWTDATHKLAAESLRSQVKRLRRFASMTSFLYSSDQVSLSLSLSLSLCVCVCLCLSLSLSLLFSFSHSTTAAAARG